jgi:hypothetical protein
MNVCQCLMVTKTTLNAVEESWQLVGRKLAHQLLPDLYFPLAQVMV